MLAMYFSLMASQTAGIGEATTLAFRLVANVRSLMLVNMFPITRALACTFRYSKTQMDTQIGRMVGLTSIRTSSKIRAAAVVHVLRGRNTASLLRFEEVLETCGYFDENPHFPPHSEMASKAFQGLLRLAEASRDRTTPSAQRCCYRDLDSLAYRSCATRDQIPDSPRLRLPLEDSPYSPFGFAEHRVG